MKQVTRYIRIFDPAKENMALMHQVLDFKLTSNQQTLLYLIKNLLQLTYLQIIE